MLELIDEEIIFPKSNIFKNGFKFSITSMQNLFQIFNTVVNTQSAKNSVTAWVNSGFDSSNTLDVMKSIIVCFGGGDRIWGKRLHEFESNIESINCILECAYNKANIHDFSAIDEVKRINGIGDTYSTKFVRFFNDNFPIIDSRIAEAIKHDYTDDGYRKYVEFCSLISEKASMPIANVESCIFCAIQIKSSNKKIWRKFSQIEI